MENKIWLMILSFLMRNRVTNVRSRADVAWAVDVFDIDILGVECGHPFLEIWAAEIFGTNAVKIMYEQNTLNTQFYVWPYP